MAVTVPPKLNVSPTLNVVVCPLIVILAKVGVGVGVEEPIVNVMLFTYARLEVVSNFKVVPDKAVDGSQVSPEEGVNVCEELPTVSFKLPESLLY